MNRVRLASLLAAALFSPLCLFADACPSGAPADPSTYSMAATAGASNEAPKIGQRMAVFIDRVALPLFTACIDADVVKATNIKSSGATTFDFQVPGDPRSNSVLTGTHT